MTSTRLISTNQVCLCSINTDGCPEVTKAIGDYFQNKGEYKITSLPATIQTLMNLPKCSVFFFATHGLSPDPANKMFAIETTEPVIGDSKNNTVTLPIDAIFTGKETTQPDGGVTYSDITLPNGKVISSGATIPSGTTVSYGNLVDAGYLMDNLYNTDDGSSWYNITETFVQTFWAGKFETDSMVVIQACYAFNDRWKNFRNIIENTCGASVYGGWTWGTTLMCDDDISRVFDRLLGANIYNPVLEPPERPFSLDLVINAIAGKNDSSLDGDTGNMSKLCFEPANGKDLGLLLAPTIEFVEIDEGQKTVTLHGSFGSNQPKIRVFVRSALVSVQPGGTSGYELVQSASPDTETIICTRIPDSGDGSAGYIVAAADYGNGMVESNAVPITAWNGTFTYTLWAPGQDSGSAIQIGQITVNAFLRGDIHRPRKVPEGDPQPRYCAFCIVKDAANLAQYTSGGTYTNPQSGSTFTWHGSGSFAVDGKGPGVVGICGWHRQDPVHPRLFVDILTTEGQAEIDGTDKYGNKIATNLTSPISTVYLAQEKNSQPYLLDFLNGSLCWPEAEGKYESSYNIPTPNNEPITNPVLYSFIDSSQKIITASLTWGTLIATFAPDDNIQA